MLTCSLKDGGMSCSAEPCLAELVVDDIALMQLLELWSMVAQDAHSLPTLEAGIMVVAFSALSLLDIDFVAANM